MFARLPRFALLALFAATQLARAAETIDLDRVTPVPPDVPIPVQDFFRPALLTSPAMNDAGTHVAAIISPGRDKSALLVYELATQEFETLRGLGDRDIHAFHWVGDTRLAFSLASEKRYGDGIYAANIGHLSQSYSLLEYEVAYLVGVPDRDRTRPLYWILGDVEGVASFEGKVVEVDSSLAFRINMFGTDVANTGGNVAGVLERNERHVLRTYPKPKGGLVTGYLPDRNGELAFGFTTKDGVTTLHRFAGNVWEECPLDLDAYNVESFGEKPNEILVVTPPADGQPRRLQFMDAATAQLGEILVADADYDFVGSLHRDPVSRQVVGVSYERNGPKMIWFTEAHRALQKALEAFFPGKVVRHFGGDKSGQHHFVGVYSDRQPTIYYRVDLEKRTLGLVKASRPWIEPDRMQPVSMMKFKTAEGRSLDAYVTLPPGTSKQKPAPLVVLPHGGPWVRDTWHFDGEAQFLANRGYAVLQPNYRGSPGYDWMFPFEDRWAFRKMHDDVTAALKALLASGLIDRQHVAIMGSSFGGYLALSGVVHEPETYRCAVTIAGIFDWEMVIKEEKYNQYDNLRHGYFLRHLGNPKTEQAKFDEISPLRHIANLRVPIFVAHGMEDPVASVNESKRLVDELENLRLPHEKYFPRGEGHGMSYLKNEVELYTRILAFLDHHLKAPPASTAAQ